MSDDQYEPLHERIELSATLPGFFYFDHDVFLKEQERIFSRTWQLVAHESQLPQQGDYLCTEVAGESIFIIHSSNSTYRAFYNVCAHRAHQILTGQGRARNSLVCPYHGWSYDLRGGLLGGRGIEKIKNFDKGCNGLTSIRVETLLGFIFVNLDENAIPLSEFASGMFDDMRQNLPWTENLKLDIKGTGESWSGVDLEANWKVLADNCRECYHCSVAHKDFVDMVDMRTYQFDVHKNWSRGDVRLGKKNNRAYEVDQHDPQTEARFWHLWPNTEFGVLPGQHSLAAFRSYPAGPDLTRMTTLILSGDGSSLRKNQLDYRWNVFWPEDEAICKSVHQGLKSRAYRQGRFVFDSDNQGISEDRVHLFQLRYAREMGYPVVGD